MTCVIGSFNFEFLYFYRVKKTVLNRVNFPSDIRAMDINMLRRLATELRDEIITTVATKEGHLGASLGVIELTIALHYVFKTPEDILVWDVGHQAYGHKIITGRKTQFKTNRQLNGLSGFPKRSESIYDTFGVGHSSTSISAVLGMAIASRLKGDVDKQHIAVIGDASIASGMAFEGLNHAGVTKANVLIILNDNAIGIDPSVGALKQYFTNVKSGVKSQDNIFEALNFNYSGPIDGHDLEGLIKALQHLKSVSGPKFLHITTTKGKGLKPAELDQVRYHAPGKFDAKTGHLNDTAQPDRPPKYQDVFGKTILKLAQKNKNIVGITPAMPTGSSLKFMMEAIPERAFDVGIAEQHAVTLAAGMAAQGLTPYCTIYSTFLQRAYDQVIHDVALQNLPVIFCIDRAGLVGEDGPTHHGVFDLAYLNCIPNLIIFAPKDAIALQNILYTAQLGLSQPLAIRYPRGRGHLLNWETPYKKITIGTSECIKTGSELALIAIGAMVHRAEKAIAITKDQEKVGLYDIQFLKPLDKSRLHEIFKSYKTILTLEEGCEIGGLGQTIVNFASEHGYKNPIKVLGIKDKFIDHGQVNELLHGCGLDETSIAEQIKAILDLI